jgi:hypothetical protein
VHAIHDVASERLQTDSKIFAFTRWDIVPVFAELLHLTYFWAVFPFPACAAWVMLILGFIYSVSIS